MLPHTYRNHIGTWSLMRCIRLAVILFGCMISIAAATLPVGFSETQIAGGLNPTTMVFAPDGRLFLCEKQGRIRVIKNGALLATPMVDFSAQVDSWNERGLGGICCDPAFTTNGWIYVYYTANSPASHNRVSRFTVIGDTAANGSEQVIFDITNLSSIGWHNGGGLRFGQDGKLYISTGENANGAYAQNTGNLLGKLLRINKDGTIPTDNPNYGTYTGSNRAIVALGLRNPFSMAVQPGTGLLYINNVGGTYEEIHSYSTGIAPVARNYGWPSIDGLAGGQSTPSNYGDPVHVYGTNKAAICGGDFYNPSAPATGAFPSTYTGKFFFSDYAGWIKYIDPANPGTSVAFAQSIARPIDVEIAPDGTMWYLARAGIGGGSDADNTASTNGTLWRVSWNGGGGATKLAFTVQPSAVGTDVPITPAVKVAIQDASGATVTSATNTVTIAIANNPASGSLSGTLSTPAVNGVATFSNLSLNNVGNGYTLAASSATLTGAISSAFNVVAQVATPVITPNGGTFSGPIWVWASCATPGATIRYTIDGSTPTSSSPVYTGPGQLPGGAYTLPIKIIAQKSGLSDSAVVTAVISIAGNTPYGMNYRYPVSGVTMPETVTGSLPNTLSGTGLFSNVTTLTATDGFVPYDVNSPLWSDNAQKQRWVALPGSEKIAFAPTGEYAWPGGTIFIKHFDLVTNEVTLAKRRLETRVLVLDATGGNGYGVTYLWRGDNSEADLVPSAGLDETITITTSTGTREQVWHYPSRDQCLQCHTANAGFVLGPKTRQLNGSHTYPTGRSDNQIRTWNYLQMFTTQVDEGAIAGYSQMVKIDNSGATLENRVRSYLDANCSHCHRPGGTGAFWDGRYDTPLANQNIINGDLRDSLGITGAKVVVPADIPKSIMHLRMNSTVLAQQMPPLARNVVDTAAVSVVAQWIAGLPPTGGGGTVPLSGGIYRVTAKHSNKLLEIIDNGAGSLTQNGTKAQQWSARTGVTNQDWRMDDMGSGWWKMTNIASGKVLEVPGGSTNNSIALVQSTDVGGTNQRWSLTNVGGGWFAIVSQVSGKYLDVNGASAADGAEIHQYQSTGADNQRWSFTEVSPPPTGPITGATYRIIAKHSGKAMEVYDNGAGGINLDGTYIQQWTILGGSNQHWRLDSQGGGWWKLTNVLSGKVLHVPNNSTANSIGLQQWTDSGIDAQRWSFTEVPGGWYKITSKLSGKLADVAGVSTANGARINQYQENGQDNQLWMLEMVAPAAFGSLAPHIHQLESAPLSREQSMGRWLPPSTATLPIAGTMR